MFWTVARFEMRPVRRLVDSWRNTGRGRHTWGLRLGPVEVCGRSVVLRSPRLSDAAAWREIRLRDREKLEPWWITSELSWEDRHTDAAWVSSLLHARQEAKAGRALPLVVEFDGRMVGQISLEWIELHTGNSEMGVWVDSRVYADTVSMRVGAAMLLDHAFLELGLYRVTAPIADGNRAAAWGARRVGMRHEGLMRGFLDVGGARTDHHLWAITADQVPPGGLTKAVCAALERRRRSAQPAPAADDRPCAFVTPATAMPGGSSGDTRTGA